MFSFGYKRNGEGWPIATWSITATTCLIYLISSSDTSVMEVLVGTLGFVPLQFSLHPAANLHRLITAEFLHLDAFHLLGNLIFLVSFGRAVEGALGRLSFAAAFIGLGALSFLGSWLADPASPIPIIGNSGAIAFLLGGYALLFPQARIRLLVFFKWPFIPTWLFATIWFCGQIILAIWSGEAASGVAYYTHIAGFCLGGVAAACWLEFGIDTHKRISRIAGTQK